MTAAMLQERLAKVQAAKEAQFRRHELLSQQREACVADINALAGREAELTELLALLAAPPGEAAGG